jgi:hypothetical protein
VLKISEDGMVAEAYIDLLERAAASEISEGVG